MSDAHADPNATEKKEEHKEEKKLEEKLKQAEKKQHEAQKKAAEHIAPKSNSHENLENKVNSGNNLTIFEKMGVGIAKGVYSIAKPFWTPTWMVGSGLLSFSLAGISPFILATGMGTGRYFINKKLGKEFTFQDFKIEYLKGMFSGSLFYPISLKIHHAPSIATKLLMFFGIGSPTFMTADNFIDHYHSKYKTPSGVAKEIYKRNIGSVIGEGIDSSVRALPKSYFDWFKNTKGILPAIVAYNWSASYPIPAKYAVSTFTASGYRYYTSKQLEAHNNAKNGKNKQEAPSNVLPMQQQYTPQQAQQMQAMQQYLAKNPQAAQQLAQQYAMQQRQAA